MALSMPTAMTDRGAVLVVEDDPNIRAFVKDTLEDVGYPVREAPDGAAALDALRRERPLALVLDLSLPYVDGVDVARASQSLYDGDVPTVVISAVPTADADARDVGASGFLRKPFLVEELESVVGRALAGRGSLSADERELADRRALEQDTSRARHA
jgi:DNA-binding response OmpR family regulator